MPDDKKNTETRPGVVKTRAEPATEPATEPAESEAPKPSPAASMAAEMPKYLTAVGGMIAAIAALLTALNGMGLFRKPVNPTSTAVPTSFVVVTETKSLPTATSVPSPAASSAITPSAPTRTALPPGLLLADDFSDPGSGWDTAISPEVDRGYENGEYRITIFKAEYAAWANLLQIHHWKDVAIDVDARAVDGLVDNQLGITVRYDQENEDFYLFSIDSSGGYMVEMRKDDEWTTMVERASSPAVRKDKAVNHLRVECLGNTMRFYANGELLVKVEDSTLASGDVGLLASALGKPPVIVAFDNIRIRSLD